MQVFFSPKFPKETDKPNVVWILTWLYVFKYLWDGREILENQETRTQAELEILAEERFEVSKRQSLGSLSFTMTMRIQETFKGPWS